MSTVKSCLLQHISERCCDPFKPVFIVCKSKALPVWTVHRPQPSLSVIDAQRMDIKGRITKQRFPEGICQTFTYDDAHRRNSIYYSETGKTEVYEYNKELLTERTIFEDGTCTAYEYSDQNLRTKETSRTGAEKQWEYDAAGFIILPSGGIAKCVCLCGASSAGIIFIRSLLPSSLLNLCFCDKKVVFCIIMVLHPVTVT